MKVRVTSVYIRIRGAHITFVLHSRAYDCGDSLRNDSQVRVRGPCLKWNSEKAHFFSSLKRDPICTALMIITHVWICVFKEEPLTFWVVLPLIFPHNIKTRTPDCCLLQEATKINVISVWRWLHVLVGMTAEKKISPWSVSVCLYFR